MQGFVPVLAAALLLGGLAGWCFQLGRHRRALSRRLQLLDAAVALLQPGLTFDSVAAQVLELVSQVLVAPGYYLYIPGGPGEQLLLAAAKVAAPGSLVGPDYSGLVRGFPIYEPPLSISREALAGRVLSGELQLLTVKLEDPAGALQGVLRLGPLPARPRGVPELEALAPALAGVLALFAAREELRKEVDASSSRTRASGTAARLAFDLSELIALLVRLGGSLLDARAGLLLCGGDRPEVRADFGLAPGLTPQELAAAMVSLPTGGEPRPVPPAIAAHLGPATALTFAVGERGRLVYLLGEGRPVPAHLEMGLATVSNHLALALEHSEQYARLSRSYLDALQGLVDVLDSRQPFTVGHSVLVADNARTIARAFGLPAHEVERVYQAGLLHDVGMLALDESILFNPGQLSDPEYQEVQRHPDTGAAMLAGVPEAAALVPMVRHHHERWDGWGYPDRLQGEAIPLGARIIALAEIFVARLSHRPYRAAVPFDEALADVSAGSGTRFDPALAMVFVEHIQEERRRAPRDRWLRPCWDLKQCPAPLRSACPAAAGGRNCWEVPDVLCRAHGDSDCQRCLVWTEFQGRGRVH